MTNLPLYLIIFKDGTKYVGGNYQNTGWTDIPNKPIKRIIYNLRNGDNLVLNGYDKYFHMIEATVDANGSKAGQTILRYIYIMGKRNKLIICYKINIKTGNIEKKVFNEKDNFIEKLNKNGWKG